MDKTIYTREYGVLLRLLKKARQDAGVTQIELAARLEETQSAVSKIERGERRLDVVELRTICRAIGIPFIQFLQQFERDAARRS